MDLDANYGAAALCLVDLLRLQLPEKQAAARSELERVKGMVKAAGGSPLLQARKAAVEQLVRALAERAFDAADPAALPIRGKGEALSDGRIRVRYPGDDAQGCADFELQKEADDNRQRVKLSYGGPTQLTPGTSGMELIGSGQLNWPIPLRGKQEYEFAFEIRGTVSFNLVVCADPDNGFILIEPDGTAVIADRKSGIFDQIGAPGDIYRDKVHRLRVVHDGEKKVEVFFDGARTAQVPNVGARVRGSFGILVHSSTAVIVKEVVVTGVPDPSDPTQLREHYVLSVLAGLWP
jgi:hypothetical protein